MRFYLLLALFAIAGCDFFHPPAPEPITVPTAIEVQTLLVPFNPDRPSDTKLGGLTYLKGWALSSDFPRFGGFSGMTVSGTRLVALSDRGDWLTADFDWQNDEKPLANPVMMGFVSNSAREKSAPLKKGDLDAESLTRVPDGYLIGFEQRHRVVKVTQPGAAPTPVPYLTLPDFQGLSHNSGIEAMAIHKSGKALLFAEHGVDQAGNRLFWEADEQGYLSRGYKDPKNHAPTDAKILPGGDVLVVNRNYSKVSGNSIILTRIAGDQIPGTAPLTGREIAWIKPPLTIDNMEALAVIGEDQGKPVIALLSDDNFNSSQRTLLLIFRIDGD